MRLLTSLFCCFLLTQSFSQTNTNQDKIKSYIETYFLQDREIIHVQFNKNSFVNNEFIALKGYVYSKTNTNLHSKTTNVELVIYDANKNVIQKQLLYTTKGIFSANIQLTDKFKSGNYTFHFYTNWMNNFREDNSFTQTLEIIDKNEAYSSKTNEPNWKTAKISFYPESGIIVDGINNNVGVKITDCNQKGLEIKDIIIEDSKSNEIIRFATNKMGNGYFYFIPILNEKYFLKIKSNELNLTQELPQVKETGIVLTYNNKMAGNKVAIAIKTNEKGLSIYENKKFTVLIQQDGNLIIQNLSLENKETENVFIINKKHLFNGVNSIRLIDENLNQVTERLLYNHSEDKLNTTLEAKVIANDSIQLIGKSNITQADLSISVLPKQNICVDQKNSILGTFLLNAYLENPETDNYNYYDLENNNRFRDIDLLMMNQIQSKYYWENIKANPPKMEYPFEVGVTIKGKVNDKLKPDSKNKITIISLKNNVFDETTADKNGEFTFDNFFAKDSTVFLFQAFNEKNNLLKNNITARITRKETPYSFPIRFLEKNCPKTEQKDDKSIAFINLKKEDKTILLEEISVKNNFKKVVLTNQNSMSMNAKGFKISENEHGRVLDFIGMNGYRTGVDPEENNVYIESNRRIFSSVAPNPPAVYIDNNIIFDLNLLFNMSLEEVDEIYIDQSGASDTSAANNGTIKIFLKVDNYKKDVFKINYSSLIVTKGFANSSAFENTEFETQQGFYSFGTLFWSPSIIQKDNSSFAIKFPRGNQHEVQVLVEGISKEGQLISELKTIPVEKL